MKLRKHLRKVKSGAEYDKVLDRAGKAKKPVNFNRLPKRPA